MAAASIGIYLDSDVCRWHLSNTQLIVDNYFNIDEFLSSNNYQKIAIFHVPFPYDQGIGPAFESRIDRLLNACDVVIVMISELHDLTVDFMRRYQQDKIKYFACGAVEGVDSFLWMDWFITSRYFYQSYDVLSQLTPYKTKPKFFDILLGMLRPHRDIINSYINDNNISDKVIMTYLGHDKSITSGIDTDGWIWGNDGIETTDAIIKWTVSPIKYLGVSMSLSQVVPIQIYNQTAYSLVAETNFSDNFVFHTEKIVKPILARRLFIVFGGRHYLKNLHRLGFKTFDGIIDESYDDEVDYVKRGQRITKQIEYLLNQDQQTILDQVKPITEHNYKVMMETDWLKTVTTNLRQTIEATYTLRR